MDCGEGRSYFCRLSYRPVPGVRKSGIPAETEIPAPHMRTMLRHGFEAMCRATPHRSKV